MVLDVGLGDESGAGFGSVEEFLEVVLGLVGGLITLAHCDIILLPIIIFATLVELLIFLTSFWGYKNAYSFCGRKKDVFGEAGGSNAIKNKRWNSSTTKTPNFIFQKDFFCYIEPKFDEMG